VERYVGYWIAISYSEYGVHVCLLVMTNQKARCDPSTVVVSPSEAEHHRSAARCKMNGSSQDESCHQFADLEEPADGIIVDASVAPPDVIVTQILNRLPTAV
jgi:hypothetical protein